MNKVKYSVLDKNVDFKNDWFFNDDIARRTDVKVYNNYYLQVVLSSRYVIISSTDNVNQLKNWEEVVDSIVDAITRDNEYCIKSIVVEASTLDYIENISQVNEKYKYLVIEPKLKLGYNIDRKKYGDADIKSDDFEHLNTKHITRYLQEQDMSYYKEEDFSTAEYYDKYIGRVETKIALYKDGLYIGNSNCISVIAEYRARLQQILIKSFTDQYLKKLL